MQIGIDDEKEHIPLLLDLLATIRYKKRSKGQKEDFGETWLSGFSRESCCCARLLSPSFWRKD